MSAKKLILTNLPYLLFVYPFDKVAQAFRLTPGTDLSGKLLSIGEGFAAAFAGVGLSFHPTDLLISIAGAVILRVAVYMKSKNAKKYRHGMEYGSARWGTPADIAPYMDKDFFQNIPMTMTERITMASRPKQPKYARNKNILVIGGSGSGKTRFFCKPSLLQAHSSYVVTDPKGTLLPEVGSFLERKKYRIKCLNLINFRKSMKYNPLAYIRSEKDILKLVNALIMNTKGEGEKSSEDFWVKAERLYYSALIGYIWYEAPEEERNFITLLDLINASEAREDDETYQSPVDILFQQLEEREPDHFAVKQYRKFKMAAGKTLKSILISCGARLAPFDIKELRDLIETDEMELDTLGDSKAALFVIISDTDSTFNFVAALMYSQLFNLLCDKADDFYGGRLPVHVRLILDEFANIGQIPNFDKLIATIRSREISASIILQSQSQLKTIYKDAADTIVGNCDSTLFLGGKEKSTLKEISELLGKETIDLYNQSENRGTQISHGLNYQKLGKDMPYLLMKSSAALKSNMNRDTISWIRRKIEYRRSLMEHLPKKTSENGICYTLVGDYYIPDLQLPEENRSIGIWGRMHKAYLELYHPAQYNDLILTGKLWTYLADLNEQAQNRLDCIIAQMKETEEITEELKARDQMAWVRAMNSIRNRAEEIVRHELIYDAKEVL